MWLPPQERLLTLVASFRVSKSDARPAAGTSSGMARDPSSSPPPASGNPDEEILSADRLESLRTVLDQLPDELRRCFLLRHARGFCESEIAVLMKLPIERVRTYLWQARQMLGVGGSGEVS